MSSDIKLHENKIVFEAESPHDTGMYSLRNSVLNIDPSNIYFKAKDGESSTLRITGSKMGANIKLCSKAVKIESGDVSIISPDTPQVLRIQSTVGFGACRVEFWSDKGSQNEWRPVFIESIDSGNFTGGLKICVNGTGAANKTGSVEIMRISTDTVDVNGNLKVVKDIRATEINTDKLNVKKELKIGMELPLTSTKEHYITIDRSSIVAHNIQNQSPPNGGVFQKYVDIDLIKEFMKMRDEIRDLQNKIKALES